MKTNANVHAGLFLLLIVSFSSKAQELRTFNQNSSRTNHYTGAISSGLNLTFSPVFSTALNKSNDSLLFRGNGGGFRIAGDYFFGKAGIGFSSGFGSSSADANAINRFLQRVNVSPSEVTITKSNQQNMYLLLGPSVRFGSKVEMLLHAKGGLFINNSGLVMIQQKGAVRPAYMNGATGKSIYPGFQTGVSIQYSTKSDSWSFGIGADYMGTKTEVNNYDQRRNGGIEALKLSQTISDLVAGINVKYYIPSVRHKQDRNTSQRLLPTVNKKEIAIDEPGTLTKRVLPTVNKKEIAIDEPGMSTQRLLPTVNKKEIIIDENGSQTITNSSCGPVTMQTTNPDGSVSEMTFACPDDAATYNQRTSSPRQTQGSSFGEKVQQGLQKNGVIHRDVAARNILLGKISLVSGNVAGIETNETISSTERTTPGKPKYDDINLRMYAKERSSAHATESRQYQLVFADDATDTCSDCAVSVVSNPLYQSSGNTGQNPLYESKDKRIGGTNDDCDGISGLSVFLMDAESGAVLASTKTETCGEFFFANLPSGPYVVKVTGTITSKKGYDVYLKNKADVAGVLLSGNDRWVIEFNTGTGTAEQAAAVYHRKSGELQAADFKRMSKSDTDIDTNEQAAVIKTKTKSNQSNDRIVNTQDDNSGIIWSPKSNFKVLPMALQMGTPIGGIIVKGGKNPGGSFFTTTTTNDQGEFEFTNLAAGNYKFIMEQTLALNDETVLWVGDEDSSDSNQDESVRKGWDGTIKGSSIQKQETDNANNTNDDNSANEKVIVKGWDPVKKENITQKQNTVPVKWMAPESMQRNINTSEDNLKNILISLDALEQQLDSDQINPNATVNTSRGNIKRHRAAINNLIQTLDNLQMMDKDAAMKELEQKRNQTDIEFIRVRDSIHKLGTQYNAISNVLKSRHDIAMNAIRNMK